MAGEATSDSRLAALRDTALPLAEKFAAVFGSPPVALSFAPGRINLIGEHVDYCNGCVLPACVTQGVSILINPRHGGGKGAIEVACTANGGAVFTFTQAELDAAPDAERAGGWTTYIGGVILDVAAQLEIKSLAHVSSAALLIDGNVPMGAGMSSSAALCVAAWNAVEWIMKGAARIPEGAELVQSAAEKVNVALSARAIETKYCGAKIGIMDQFASVHGRPGTCIELHCATLEHTHHALPLALTPGAPQQRYVLLLVNSMVQHKLGADYNAIRSSIEGAQAAVGEALDRRAAADGGAESASRFSFAAAAAAPGEFGFEAGPGFVDALFSVVVPSPPSAAGISAADVARGRYVVEEMLRTRDFIATLHKIAALESATTSAPDAPQAVAAHFNHLGELLTETHRGLSRQLGVSTEEIEAVHAALVGHRGVLGARLMGGGFGGCVLALVEKSAVAEVTDDVRSAFAAAFPAVGPCDCFEAAIGGGAYLRSL